MRHDYVEPENFPDLAKPKDVDEQWLFRHTKIEEKSICTKVYLCQSNNLLFLSQLVLIFCRKKIRFLLDVIF